MADKAPCITDQLLEGFLRCKRKSSLLREETSTPLPEYAQLIAERDVEFQTTATETLVRNMQKEEIVIRLSTPDQLTRGHELILNAPIRTDRSYCRIDFLRSENSTIDPCGFAEASESSVARRYF